MRIEAIIVDVLPDNCTECRYFYQHEDGWYCAGIRRDLIGYPYRVECPPFCPLTTDKLWGLAEGSIESKDLW